MSVDREAIGEFARILVQSLTPLEITEFYRTYHDIIGNDRWNEYTALAMEVVRIRRKMDKLLTELDKPE